MAERPKVYYEPAADFGSGFHCEGTDGADFTLCGFSLDGDQGDISEVARNPPRVDCPRCLAIIRFCRTMPARAIGRAASSFPSQPRGGPDAEA